MEYASPPEVLNGSPFGGSSTATPIFGNSMLVAGAVHNIRSRRLSAGIANDLESKGHAPLSGWEDRLYLLISG
jgi:hypothetical protein